MTSDMCVIKNRYTKLLFDGYFISTKYDAHEEILINGDIPDTFCWVDIDYSDETRSAWSADKHYFRLQYMLVSGGKEKLQQDHDWRMKLLGLLKYWLSHDFLNPNWWYNQIGVPQAMSNIMLMLESYLSIDMQEMLLEIIARGSMKTDDISDHIYAALPQEVRQWTGANLLWGAATTVKHAILTNDSELLYMAYDRICKELKYDIEGIQLDGAFCQHGPRWYSGGYGRSFAYEIAPFIFCFQGTCCEFPKEKVNILLKHVLDGQRLMQQNGYFDYGAVGREFTRPGDIHAGVLTSAVKLQAETEGIPRKKELQEFWKELSGKCTNAHEETKFYDSICVLCHKKAGSYIGIRGSSSDILGAENCNDEGILCYNMTYGTNTCFMRSGQEYMDLSPVWDYAKIPGTTARQENDKQLLQHSNWTYRYHQNNKTIGLTKGEYGILSTYTAHDDISLYTSYFVFDGCMATLGAGIKDKKSEKGMVLTTVDQCRAKNVNISCNGKMVENNGWCYRNLDDKTTFHVEYTKKIGSWHRNNHAMSSEIVTEYVFTLAIPFKEEHNAYAYLVSPQDSTVEIEILCNNEICQGILVNHKTAMIFFHQNEKAFIFDNI